MFKKLALIAALSTSSAAFAAEYYIVVPFNKKPAQASPAPSISVSLNSYALPAATVELTYSGFNLNDLLVVTGDSNYVPGSATWSVVSGALPAGISLSTSGALSGTPTVPGISSFVVRANYESNYAEKSYNLNVGADFGLFNVGEGVNADRISAATPKYGRVTVGAKPISSGKHYVELDAKGYRHQFGITTKATNDTLAVSSVYPLENKTDAVAAYLTSVSSNVFAYINASAATKISGPLSTCSDSNCMVGLAIDADNNTVTWIGPSGTIGSYTILMPKPWYVTVARGNSNTGGELSVELNTGQKAFTYAVPNGFRPGLY